MDGEGGFLQPTVLTPPASLATSTTVQVNLPHPRQHPLAAGSSKESMLRRFVDQNIDQINRRHAKRSSENQNGFTNFGDITKELDTLFNLIWISGTPSIQVPYLMSLALLIIELLPEYPPDPRNTFAILAKFDAAFASLLQGRNIETGETLPGFERGKIISTTEMVRLKSMVDQTRLVVVKALQESDFQEMVLDSATEEEDDDDLDEPTGDEVTEAGTSREEMGISRVYDKTIVELGVLLARSPAAGLITDD